MKLGAYTACLHDKPLARGPGDPARARPGQRGDQLGRVPAPRPPAGRRHPGQPGRPRRVPRACSAGRHHADRAQLQRQPARPQPRGRAPSTPRTCATRSSWRRCWASSASSRCPGCPAPTPGARYPSWTVEPWDSVYLDARDYQWNEVAHPVLEGHPGAARPTPTSRSASRCTRTTSSTTRPPWSAWPPRSTPPTSAPRWTPATCSGRASTRSLAIEHLGGLVYNAAAKDTRINEAAKLNGVLDDRFGRVAPDDPGAVCLGGRYTLSRWPERLLLGLRRRRPRPRRRLLDRVPASPGRGRPRHGRQHRARGPGTRPARGPAAPRPRPSGRPPPGWAERAAWPGSAGVCCPPPASAGW